MVNNIKAYVRIRPFTGSDTQKGAIPTTAIEKNSAKSLVFNPSTNPSHVQLQKYSTTRSRLNFDQHYSFDRVFDHLNGEDDIYDEVARPIVNSVIYEGQNGSLFAYGATGCGKTHTITNIVTRICEELFERVNNESEKIRVTYLEIYNEKIIDLLPKTPGRGAYLDLRGNKSTLQVAGLTEHFPQTISDLRALISQGNSNRIVKCTNANSQSSRSHSVLTFYIDRVNSPTSILSITDLAGSERAQGTDNRGKRMVEGANINRSLLSLGNCINARASGKKYIPYRDSKLTRLLQYSLEGGCLTSMIVCVSPSITHFEETRNTLEYGKRATSIVMKKGFKQNNCGNGPSLQTKHDLLLNWKESVIVQAEKVWPGFQSIWESMPFKTAQDFTQAVLVASATTIDKQAASLNTYSESRSDVSIMHSDLTSPLKRLRQE